MYYDICGCLEAPSLEGSIYFITFVYEHTIILWLYTINFKSESFEVFKKFKVLVEKESVKAIKVLRTDVGREYTSKEFEAYCINKGIRREVALPYTPYHNVIAEIRNKTILDMAKSILKNKNLSHMF